MIITRAAIFAALFLWTSAVAAWAEDITLTSRDGSVEISGTLLGYDGEFYRVDTVYGVLTVDGSGVICDGPGCPDLGAFVAEVTISGARTMGEVLLPSLVEAFAARSGFTVERRVSDDAHFEYVLAEPGADTPAARFRFRVTSTAEGFADLLANEADLVLSMRPATDRERDLAREAGLGDLHEPRRNRIVALDALVPIVAPGNPLRGITLSDLAQVFAGNIDNWSTLGGPDAAIVLHLREGQSGLAQDFRDRVLSASGLSVSPAAILHASNSDLADAVRRDPLAIGITAFSELGNAAPVAIRGACGMESAAGVMTIKSEDYPLTAPLFIYIPARRLPVLVREFLAFARSPAAQPVVERAGFVDLRLDRVPVAGQGVRLANAVRAADAETGMTELQRMVDTMDGTARLSLSFRFRIGTTTLDPQSQSNVDLLARQLEAGAFDDTPLLFVGFTDGDGSATTNLRLARRRAEAVRRAVLQAAPTADRTRLTLKIDAFGEAMPMACDDAEWGKQINRRVEVWVAD